MERDSGQQQLDCINAAEVSKGKACQYCGKVWPSRGSLSQHIRNKHMAESQQDRIKDHFEPPSRANRVNWTEERRQAFLDIADRVGWANHSVIAQELGLTEKQVRNFKIKFPKDRWKTGSHSRADSEIATGPSNDCSDTRSSGSSSPSVASDGQTDSFDQTECESSNLPDNTQSDTEMQVRDREDSRSESGPTGDADTRFSGERPIPNQTAGTVIDANCGQTEPPPDRETRSRRSVDVGTQTDFDTGYSSGSPIPDSAEQTGTHSQSDSSRSQSSAEQGTDSNDPKDMVKSSKKSGKWLKGQRKNCKSQSTNATTPSGSSEKADQQNQPKKKRRRRRGKRRGKQPTTVDVPTEQTTQSSDPNSEPQKRGPKRPRNQSQGDPPHREERSQPDRRGGRSQNPPRVQSAGVIASSGRNSQSGTSSETNTPRPSARRWLTLAYEEVTEEYRKELNDFVDSALKDLEGASFEWEKFEQMVQALVDKVASKCEFHMDDATTSRPVKPNQGWRWRKKKRHGQNSTQTSVSSSQSQGSPAGQQNPVSENPVQNGRGNHNARARRRQVARKGFDRFEAQRLQRLFRRNRKSCVREILEGKNDHRCNIPVEQIKTFFQEEYSEKVIDVDHPPRLAERLSEGS